MGQDPLGLNAGSYPLNTACYLLSTVCYQLRSVSHTPLSPVRYTLIPVCYPLSPVCYPLIPVCYPLSPVCYPLIPVCYLPSPVCYTLSPIYLTQYHGHQDTASCSSFELENHQKSAAVIPTPLLSRTVTYQFTNAVTLHGSIPLNPHYQTLITSTPAQCNSCSYRCYCHYREYSHNQIVIFYCY